MDNSISTNNKSESLFSDLEKILKKVDTLIEHLNKQEDISGKDLEVLKGIIFHIDGILVKLNNKKEKLNYNIILLEIINTLGNANEHLKHALLHHKQFYKTNSSKKTTNNIFQTLLTELKKL